MTAALERSPVYAADVGPSFVLMDVNKGLHRGVIFDNFLKNERNAPIEWQGFSPDLNPTENL